MELDELLSVDVTKLVEPPSVPQREISNLARSVTTHINLFYNANDGEYPSIEMLTDLLAVPAETIRRVIDEEVNDLLDARGLPVFQTSESRLSPEFVAVCNMMADPRDLKSTAAKLKLIGKNTTWWNNMLKRRENREYFEKLVDSVWTEQIETEAKHAIAKGVSAGDLATVKYYHEFTGKFRAQDNNVINLQQIILILMEILARRVDVDTLALVADEMEKKIPALTMGVTNG